MLRCFYCITSRTQPKFMGNLVRTEKASPLLPIRSASLCVFPSPSCSFAALKLRTGGQKVLAVKRL